MKNLRAAPHSERLTDTWTSDFLSQDRSQEGEGMEFMGEWLRDKTQCPEVTSILNST
jgi:hypothetical protein